RARKFGISVLLTYLSLLFIVILVTNIVTPRIYQSIMEFVEFLPVLFSAIERLILDLDANDAIPFFEISALLALISWEELLAVFHPDNITLVFGTLMDLSAALFSMALAIISSIYFMLEGDKFQAFAARVLKAFAPSSVNSGIMNYGGKVNGYFKQYIFCQVLDAIILGVIMTVVTSMLGVRHAFVIGPMLGFANLIPYFGSIIGTIVAIIIVMFTEDFAFGIIVAIVLFVIQQIDSNIIFPRLLGSSMKISPLLVIIAIAVGNAYYGVIGMIVAIPISTVLKNILDDILAAAESKQEG
ncbi:MAG: AI-2E family transporter, partial [Defluviitaleaceae bacterium]|nr:AI-2E family transporter [Defluviitaleaceae bacterium]